MNDAQKEFGEKKKQFGKILQTHVADGNRPMIGMTTDLWTDDIKHQHYMSITVYYVHDWRLTTLKNLPASLKKTSSNLRSELLSAFNELGITADLVKSPRNVHN